MKVFITGASSGIGQALATEYARRYPGPDTVLGLVARRTSLLQTLQVQLQTQYGVSCVLYALDVRDHAALATAGASYVREFGVPDVVIANAGVSSGTLTEEVADTDTFQTILDINVMGLVHTFQPFIKAMHDQGAGQLVGIASVAGIRGLPGAGAYSASKAAAIAYLESLRVEMAPRGISVTTIAPGYIRTPMTDVNTYRMPFLMDCEIAAKRFVEAIARKRRFVVIPWQMGIVARVIKLIPPLVWDWLMAKAPHKPRLPKETL